MHHRHIKTARLALALRRWKPAARVFAALSLVTAATALLLPSRYEAHLKVVVDDTNPVLPRNIDRVGLAEPAESLESRVGSEMARLTSEEVLRPVVVESHLAGSAASTTMPLTDAQEAALHRLQQDLAVTQPGGSNVILATYSSTSPEQARDVLNHLALSYRHVLRIAEAGAGTALYDRTSRSNGFVGRDESQSVSSVRVIEEPSLPQLSGTPRRGFVFACGLLLSALLAASTAVAVELFSSRIDTTSSIEQAAGIPVLASLPANAMAAPMHDAFPALYRAMQRPHHAFEGRLS